MTPGVYPWQPQSSWCFCFTEWAACLPVCLSFTLVFLLSGRTSVNHRVGNRNRKQEVTAMLPIKHPAVTRLKHLSLSGTPPHLPPIAKLCGSLKGRWMSTWLPLTCVASIHYHSSLLCLHPVSLTPSPPGAEWLAMRPCDKVAGFKALLACSMRRASTPT